MAEIGVTVKGHALEFTSTPPLAAGSAGVDSVLIKFVGQDWTGFGVTVLYCKYDEQKSVYARAMDPKTYKASIPPEIIDTGGKVMFGVVGQKTSNGTKVIITTNWLTVEIQGKGITYGMESITPDADAVAELLGYAGTMTEEYATLKSQMEQTIEKLTTLVNNQNATLKSELQVIESKIEATAAVVTEAAQALETDSVVAAIQKAHTETNNKIDAVNTKGDSILAMFPVGRNKSPIGQIAATTLTNSVSYAGSKTYTVDGSKIALDEIKAADGHIFIPAFSVILRAYNPSYQQSYAAEYTIKLTAESMEGETLTLASATTTITVTGTGYVNTTVTLPQKKHERALYPVDAGYLLQSVKLTIEGGSTRTYLINIQVPDITIGFIGLTYP